MEEPVAVVSRQQWGAVAPRHKETLKAPAQRAVIHHTGIESCQSGYLCQIRSIQDMHMEERDFDDIGYNFLVAGDGTLYEGRGWGVVGAHAKGNNHDSLGIAFMGNFNNDTPSTEALQSVTRLLQYGVSRGVLHPDFLLCGHRDLRSTQCPGAKLYAVLSQLRDAT